MYVCIYTYVYIYVYTYTYKNADTDTIWIHEDLTLHLFNGFMHRLCDEGKAVGVAFFKLCPYLDPKSM